MRPTTMRRAPAALVLSLVFVLVAGLHARDARGEPPLPIVRLGDLALVGVGTAGALAGWLTLPEVLLSEGVAVRPSVEVDALDLVSAAPTAVVRADVVIANAAIALAWSPDPSVGVHADLVIAIE